MVTLVSILNDTVHSATLLPIYDQERKPFTRVCPVLECLREHNVIHEKVKDQSDALFVTVLTFIALNSSICHTHHRVTYSRYQTGHDLVDGTFIPPAVSTCTAIIGAWRGALSASVGPDSSTDSDV